MNKLFTIYIIATIILSWVFFILVASLLSFIVDGKLIGIMVGSLIGVIIDSILALSLLKSYNTGKDSIFFYSPSYIFILMVIASAIFVALLLGLLSILKDLKLGLILSKNKVALSADSINKMTMLFNACISFLVISSFFLLAGAFFVLNRAMD